MTLVVKVNEDRDDEDEHYGDDNDDDVGSLEVGHQETEYRLKIDTATHCHGPCSH